MSTPLPPQPSPDPAALARAQARLLAEVSRLESGPTEADERALHSVSHVSWLGLQGDWEAARGDVDATADRYRFGAVFARGGLGAVRRAEDRKLGRTVAIKELLRFDDKAVRRFVREAAITARLQHPGIVPLYDLGRDAAGRPFLCMKLVEGASLEQKIAACPDLPARLGLLPHVIAAADAVAYAHAAGVIHRDLKPANILVGALGEAVVIDWGLAKDLSHEPDEVSSGDGGLDTVSDMTEAGSLLGTLRYMPPEQARGDAVDARTDVYSLGAVLYHVIAGAPPFHDRRSARLVHDVLSERPHPLAELVPAVPPALAAIVEKAMSREPGRRYADMTALAGDLRRFQAGLLVGAHSYSPGEVARLWLRRHRAVAAVAASSLTAIACLGVVAFARVQSARDAEHDQRVLAEAAQDAAEQRAGEVASRADELVLAQARLTLEVDPTAAFGVLTQLSPDPAHDGAARTLATAAWSLGLAGAPMTGPTDEMNQAIRLSDGTWLASNWGDLWQWQPGATVGERGRLGGWLCATPDGDAWAIADRNSTAVIEVHRVGVPGSRRVEPTIEPNFYVWQLLPGGDTLIGWSIDGAPTLEIDVDTGRVDPLPGPDAPPAVAGLTLRPSADGRRLAGVRDGRTLVVWNRDTGAAATVALPGQATASGGNFSPDGRTYVQPLHTRPAGEPRPFEGDATLVWRDGAAPRVVAAEWGIAARDAIVFIARRGGRTEAWAETPDGRRLWTRQVRNEGADEFNLEPSPSRDGRRVTWGFGSWQEVVDVASGTLVHEQHARAGRRALLVDGDAMLVQRPGGLLRVDLSRRPWHTLAAGEPGQDASGAISPAGRWAARHALGELARVDVATGAAELLPDVCGPWTPEYRVAVDDTGRTLIADDRGLGCLFGHGRTDILSTPAERMAGAAFAPDGARFAAAFGRSVVEWSGPQLAPREWTLPAHTHAVQYAPDGAWLAAVAWNGTLTVIDRDGRTRQLADGVPYSKDMVTAFAFAPTGATLAEYRGAHGLTLHDLAAGTTRRLPGSQHVEESRARLHYGPSGTTLAVLDDAVLQRWSLTGDDAPVRLDVPSSRDFTFLDDSTIALATHDGDLTLVDVASGTRAPLLRGVSNHQSQLAPAAGGLVLLTPDGELLRFTDAVPPAGQQLRTWLRDQADL